MAVEQIVLHVRRDGTVEAETRGLKGPKCLDAIGVLEDLLEAQTVASTFTSEYTETNTTDFSQTRIHDDLAQH